VPELLAVYGSLQSGMELEGRPELDEALRLVGPCWIAGALYDLGDYPALVRGDGSVLGELYEIIDTQVLALLDWFEQYDENDLDGSAYHRLRVRLLDPAVDAWVYLYNRDLNDVPPIPTGDWRHYLRTRDR
jgi:gamma-glutamylcyclotransferase (GGCT)/AIG2-like uncharacterized protein YtfP